MSKTLFKFAVILITQCYGIAEARELGTGLLVQAQTGLSQSSFRAAPIRQNMWAQEFAGNIGYQPLQLYPIAVNLDLSMQQMRGDFGAALHSVQGYAITPEVKGWHAMGEFVPYIKLGYRMGELRGKGTQSWESDPQMRGLTMDGHDASEEIRKDYSIRGFAYSMGLDYQAMPQLAISGQISLADTRISAHQNVYWNGQNLSHRRNSVSLSRSYLMGVQFRI